MAEPLTPGDGEARAPARRPLLLLDVDGVLNPLGVRDWPGFTPHDLGEPGTAGHMRVLLSLDHGRWLSALVDYFDLVWATSWERDADLLIAEQIGLPRGLPFIKFTEQTGWTSKLPDVIRFVGQRAAAGSMTSSNRKPTWHHAGMRRRCSSRPTIAWGWNWSTSPDCVTSRPRSAPDRRAGEASGVSERSTAWASASAVAHSAAASRSSSVTVRSSSSTKPTGWAEKFDRNAVTSDR